MRAPWEISDLTNPKTGVGVNEGVIEGVMVREGVTVMVDVAVGGTAVEVGVLVFVGVGVSVKVAVGNPIRAVTTALKLPAERIGP